MDIIEVETIRAGHGKLVEKECKPKTDGEFIKNHQVERLKLSLTKVDVNEVSYLEPW